MGNDQSSRAALLRNNFVAPAVRPYKTHFAGIEENNPKEIFEGRFIDDPTLENDQHDAGMINP